jgi:FkbM family methyltransferase
LDRVEAVIVSTDQGIFVVGIEDQGVGAALVMRGSYGLDEIKLAASLIGPSDDVLVVGAHVGAVAIPLARHCLQLAAVEANPRTYGYLLCNVSLNWANNISTLCAAASDRDETIRFVAATHNSGGSKRYPLIERPEYFDAKSEVIEVDAVRLDAALPDCRPALILMDIEGSEYRAMLGMPRLLRDARSLIIEYMPHHLTDVAGITPEDFAAPILQAGFKRMFVPSTNDLFSQDRIVRELQEMFYAGHSDSGLVFTKY